MELGLKNILLIFGAITLITQIIVAILTSTLYLTKTGDNKPLIQSTIGLLFASDYNIYTSTRELQNTQITKDYADYLKQKILLNLEIILILIYIGYWTANKIMNSSNMMEWGWLQKLTAILVIIAFYGAIEMIYTQVMYGQFVYPFKGLISIFTPVNNFYNLIDNIGIFQNTPPPNNIITNITGYS